jgi:hypothetical protein
MDKVYKHRSHINGKRYIRRIQQFNLEDWDRHWEKVLEGFNGKVKEPEAYPEFERLYPEYRRIVKERCNARK